MTPPTSDGPGTRVALSPYLRFPRHEWAALRADTPLTLDRTRPRPHPRPRRAHLAREVEEVYLPLSRLLNLYVAAVQGLYRATSTFLGHGEHKVPFLIGLAGSVAVGKSTTARVLRELLARWPNHPRVDLVTTDGFLLPTRVLEERGLMQRKGFPESYDVRALVRLRARHEGGRATRARRRSTRTSSTTSCPASRDRDRAAGHRDRRGPERAADAAPASAGQPRALRLGLLRLHDLRRRGERGHRAAGTSSASSTLRGTAFRDPSSYFHRYAALSDEEADATARAHLGRDQRAEPAAEHPARRATARDLVLRKGKDHAVEEVRLRKL